MHTSMRLALTALVLLPIAAAAQAPRTLPAPDATFDEPFSSLNVGSVRELRDGRVVVADPRDKILQLIDFKANSGMKIGREGSGPAEFGMPLRLLTGASDTTILFDPLNQRYLPVVPDGKPGATFRGRVRAAGAGGTGRRDDPDGDGDTARRRCTWTALLRVLPVLDGPGRAPLGGLCRGHALRPASRRSSTRSPGSRCRRTTRR